MDCFSSAETGSPGGSLSGQEPANNACAPQVARHLAAPAVLGTLAVAVATLLLGFAYLGNGRTLASHEAYFCVTARSMQERGDWIVPHFGDALRLKKPPLGYWLTALSATCCGGLTEFSARLPSALAGVLLVALIGYWTFCNYGLASGLCAALIQATCGAHVMFARQAIIDTLLVLLMTAATALIALQPENEPLRRARLRWLAIYGLLGLTALAKFHFGPTLVFAVALAWWGLQKQWQKLDQLLHAPGILLFAVLAWSWPFIVLSLVPDAYSVWRQETLERALGKWPEPPWYYVLGIPGMFLPWTPLVGWFLHRERKLKWRDRSPADQFLIVWFLSQFAVITLSSNKHDNYALPLIPPLSMYCGPRLARLLQEWIAADKRPDWSWLKAGCYTVAAVMLLAGFVLGERWPTIRHGTYLLSGAIAVCTATGLILWGKRRNCAALGMALVTFSLVVCGVLGWLQPMTDHRAPAVAFMKNVRNALPPMTELCLHDLGEAAETFYVPGPTFRVEAATDLKRLVLHSEGLHLVTSGPALSHLRPYLEIEILGGVAAGHPALDIRRTPRLYLIKATRKPEALVLWEGERHPGACAVVTGNRQGRHGASL